MKRIHTVLALTVASVMFFSCGGDKKKDATTTPDTEVTTPDSDTATEEVSGVQVEISGNDAMQYDKKEIRVPVGEKVTLTLKHTGKMAKEVMGHNFVLLNQGVDMADFAAKAAEASESEYIPESETASILAHTKLIGGGESTSIEFTINEAGEYDFLCTFPAHFALMQGKLIAE